MSSRAIRRLERQKLGDLGGTPEVATPGSDDVSEGESATPIVKSFNAFSFLGDDDESASADEPPQDNELPPSVAQTETTGNTSLCDPPAAKKKNKKKNKPKRAELDDVELDKYLEEVKQRDLKAGKVLTSQNTIATPVENTTEDRFEWEYNEEDRIESYDPNYKYFTSLRLRDSLALLSINSVKYLDADNEFQNLFGKLSMDVIEDANTTTSLAITPEVLQQFKRLARLTRGWGGKDRRGIPGTTRKLLFTRIRDDWLPTAQKPLGMEEISVSESVDYLAYCDPITEYAEISDKLENERRCGVKYFRFTKLNNSVQERVANTRFYAAVVMTPDPESLMQLLLQFPYHAETLLQVAMVLLRQGGDKSTSNALVEKALFVFDRSLHKSFHELLHEGKNGLIRLPYEAFMNRQFYLCLFRYIIILGERLTYFTAFTYCKLLLSFNPARDPLGVRYFIDYYAIMGEEYQWLVQYAQSPLLTTYVKWLTPGVAFLAVLAHLRLGDFVAARQLLQQAFESHRYSAYRLLELYGDVSHLPHHEGLPGSKEVALATETYLVRVGVMWKEELEKDFLGQELTRLFANSDAQNPSQGGQGGLFNATSSFVSSLWGGGTKRGEENEAVTEIPFNLIRFAILSGENKVMAHVPEKVWARDDVFEYDVIPPKDETLSYNEFTGVGVQGKVVDTLLDYVDQNVLGAIIQNQTGDDLTDLIDRLELDGAEE